MIDAVDCWKDIAKAVKLTDRKARRIGADRAAECGASNRIPSVWTVTALAALDDNLGRAFEAARHFGRTASGPDVSVLFWPTSRAMRANDGFLSLVEELGLMEYWRASKTQPDVCETEDVPFCRELKKVAAMKP